MVLDPGGPDNVWLSFAGLRMPTNAPLMHLQSNRLHAEEQFFRRR